MSFPSVGFESCQSHFLLGSSSAGWSSSDSRLRNPDGRPVWFPVFSFCKAFSADKLTACLPTPQLPSVLEDSRGASFPFSTATPPHVSQLSRRRLRRLRFPPSSIQRTGLWVCVVDFSPSQGPLGVPPSSAPRRVEGVGCCGRSRRRCAENGCLLVPLRLWKQLLTRSKNRMLASNIEMA